MSTAIRPVLWVSAVALLHADSMWAAAPQKQQARDDLDEVVVSGARIVLDQPSLREWVKRLVGKYAFEGFVELGGEGAPPDRRVASGGGRCIAYGGVPAVQCLIRVQWPDIKAEDGTDLPGGVSALSPAMITYGLDKGNKGIRSLLVDNAGMANGGLGELRGNTLTTTTPCVDLPGDCKRISRVSAQPGGKLIRMQIDIVQEATRIVHYEFQLYRVAEAKAAGK